MLVSDEVNDGPDAVGDFLRAVAVVVGADQQNDHLRLKNRNTSLHSTFVNFKTKFFTKLYLWHHEKSPKSPKDQN